MFKLKTDRELALEITCIAAIHGFKTAVFMVRKNNPTQTLNLEAIAEWVDYYKLEDSKNASGS